MPVCFQAPVIPAPTRSDVENEFIALQNEADAAKVRIVNVSSGIDGGLQESA